ncbi:MAG: hypothetical protein GC160_10215 [Acidobacteria bacterium]|nr:hypothetical protein [Acidobacteriota bacterium]
MESELVNQYAVVAYVHGPLAFFVDSLRGEFTPGCPHSAHVTVLPPRELHGSEQEAYDRCNAVLADREPFPLTLVRVSLFPETHVIKLELSEQDTQRLRDLHESLNQGPLYQNERFPYTPHITLCMNGAPSETNEKLGRARQRWAEFGGSGTFWVDSLTLVRQRKDETWADIAELPLSHPVPVYS